MADEIAIDNATNADRAWMAERARELWSGEIVMSCGVAHRVLELPAIVARIDGERVGIATYHLGDDDCELVTIDALRPRIGVGTALLEAVRRVAGDRRLWLITTNDNLDAIRFYQRRGLVLAAVHFNAIEQSRRVKPQIPRIGNYGIPIRDELVFEAPIDCN